MFKKLFIVLCTALAIHATGGYFVYNLTDFEIEMAQDIRGEKQFDPWNLKPHQTGLLTPIEDWAGELYIRPSGEAMRLHQIKKVQQIPTKYFEEIKNLRKQGKIPKLTITYDKNAHHFHYKVSEWKQPEQNLAS